MVYAWKEGFFRENFWIAMYRHFYFCLIFNPISSPNYTKLFIFSLLTKMNFTEGNNFSECGGATDEELEWFLETFSYWTEGVFQLGLGKLNLYSW